MRGRPLLAYAFVIVLLAGLGLGAQQLARASWRAYVDYPSPFTTPLPSTAGGPVLTQRVILIIVDGLRVDAFARMSLVDRYRGRASVWQAWAEEPSLSYPAWTTILSGATPEISGVTTNWYRGPVKVDHLLAAAKRNGLLTAVAGSPGWGELTDKYGALFSGAIDYFVAVPDPPSTNLPAIHDTTVQVARAGERFISARAARFILLHFPAPDLMGHAFGGVSQPYNDTVRLIDQELAGLLGPVDLATTTVIFTADHGHLDRGGHGGGEPVVRRVPLMFFGAGIAAGEGYEARQADIAPTISILLGLPLPAHSIGRPLVEALATVPAGVEQRWGQQQATFYDAYSVAVLKRHALVFTTPLGGPDPDAMLAAADDLARQMAEWRERALTRDRRWRLPFVLVLAMLPLGYAFLNRPRRDLVPALAGAAVFLGGALGFFYGRGFYFSFSVVNREDLLTQFFEARTVDAALVVGVGALVAGWVARRRGVAAGALSGLSTAYVSAYLLWISALYFVLRWGIRFPYYLPDLREGFRFYLTLVSLTPVGLLASPLILVSLVGYGIGRLGDRLFRRPRRGAAGPGRATPDTPSSAVAPGRPRSAGPASREDSTQSRP